MNLPLTKGEVGNKVYVVVGANSGLGYEASLHLAKMNPRRLIMTARNAERGEKAKQRAYNLCHPFFDRVT
jgi:retinol dehydrogenase-12